MWDRYDPAMTPEPSGGTLSLVALRLRLVTNLAVAAATIVALVAIDAALRTVEGVDVPVPPALVPTVAGAVIIAGVIDITRRRWRAWRWEILRRPDGSEILVVERGVWTRVWQAVPVERIQFVELTSGPVQRLMGLANLAVRTAGVLTPSVPLQDLEAGVADALRQRLAPHDVSPSSP